MEKELKEKLLEIETEALMLSNNINILKNSIDSTNDCAYLWDFANELNESAYKHLDNIEYFRTVLYQSIIGH